MPLHEDHDVTCYSGKVRKQSELLTAFNKVVAKDHWKNEINTFVDSAEDLILLADAIVHFTGSLANFTFECGPGLKFHIHVKAAGYFATIGA